MAEVFFVPFGFVGIILVVLGDDVAIPPVVALLSRGLTRGCVEGTNGVGSVSLAERGGTGEPVTDFLL